MQESWQKYVAEAFSTFIFVLVAAGGVLVNAQTAGSLGTVGQALAQGLVLAALIFGAWHLSGAHINPAVTVALWATGHVKTLVAIGYVVSQLVGAVVAALFLKVVFVGVSPQYYLGSPMLLLSTTPGMGILVEALVTFILVWTVFSTLVDKRASQGFGALAVGFAFAVGIMLSTHLTMGALNPARAFGPALVSSYWMNHYVYWVGPLIGGLVAGFIYHFGFMKKHA